MIAARSPLLHGRGVGVDRQVDRGERRGSAPVAVEGLHLVPLADAGHGEPVGPSAGRVGAQVGLGVVLPCLLPQHRRTDHHGAVRGGEVVQEGRVRLVEPDHGGVLVGCLHGGDVLDHVGRAGTDREPPVERGLHGRRGERRAVVEGHALAEGEGVRRVVRRDLPARRQARDDTWGLDAGLVAHEPLVQVGGQRQPVARVVDVRVGRLANVVEQPEVQHAVRGCGRGGGRAGTASARADQQQHGEHPGCDDPGARSAAAGMGRGVHAISFEACSARVTRSGPAARASDRGRAPGDAGSRARSAPCGASRCR